MFWLTIKKKIIFNYTLLSGGLCEHKSDKSVCWMLYNPDNNFQSYLDAFPGKTSTTNTYQADAMNLIVETSDFNGNDRHIVRTLDGKHKTDYDFFSVKL